MIPKQLLKEILADPYYKTCARLDSDCDGIITLEHALLYAGKQVQAKFAIIPLCWYHHLGDGLDKRWNIRKALSQATPEDLLRYPKNTWKDWA